MKGYRFLRMSAANEVIVQEVERVRDLLRNNETLAPLVNRPIVVRWKDRMRAMADVGIMGDKTVMRFCWTDFSLIENKDELRDTVIHELGHVITPRQRHNTIWKQATILIGGSGRKLGRLVVLPPRQVRRRYRRIAAMQQGSHAHQLVQLADLRMRLFRSEAELFKDVPETFTV